MNPAAERILSRSCNEALGKPVIEIMPEHGDLLLSSQDTMETEIGLGEKIYELQISSLTDRAGRPSGRVIILHDITQRKEAESEREQLIADLEAYAHTVAHDLKNPIGIILSIASLLVDDADETPPEEAEQFLAQIMQFSEKISNIIDELLLLASIRRSQEIKVTPLNMQYIVDTSLERLYFMAEQNQAEIIKPENGAWPVALGYAPWVEEMWTNYISNAIKYGGMPPKIELGATAQDDGMVRFWVRDNGTGIAQDKQAQLFTQFTRFDELRAEGYGLGLSIVKRIIDKLGGEVGVESEGVPGKGSTFYFTLPSG
jgi:signal transduction histidine kinase